MKAQIKAAIAIFTGASALALTLGFGGLGASPLGDASAAATHPSSTVAQAIPHAAGSGGHSGVHIAEFTACVSGLDC